jgi:hypothetical protein
MTEPTCTCLPVADMFRAAFEEVEVEPCELHPKRSQQTPGLDSGLHRRQALGGAIGAALNQSPEHYAAVLGMRTGPTSRPPEPPDAA